MSDPFADFDAYCQRIGFAGPATSTLATLTRLIARHAATIPFENVDVLAGRVPRLDVPSLAQKLVRHRRGGYCFEQNALLRAVLRHIGFSVQSLEARVRAGVAADVVTGRSHMALRVTIGDATYLADVGFAGLAPLVPLAFGASEGQRDRISAYRFVNASTDTLLQIETTDGWMDCYRLMPEPAEDVDYEIGNWYVATHDRAFLKQNLLVARATEEGRLTLCNEQLTLRRPGVREPEQRTLEHRTEFAEVLVDAFGLNLDDADIDAVMALMERRALATGDG